MADADRSKSDLLAEFIDASPSPYHAAATAAALLEEAGFVRFDERVPWEDVQGPGYVVRDGSLVAWRLAEGRPLDNGCAIVGAHTDSPNLRIKPQPDTGSVGYRQVGVEVYGGVLLNSWLDRDLGISGRIVVSDDGGLRELKVRVDEAIFRVPQLAIHLDSEIRDRGLLLNRQQHMAPIWGLGSRTEGAFREWIADQAGVAAADIRGWDLMLHDLTPSRRLGVDGEFLAAPRVDNLASCHAATRAILAADRGDSTPIICLFDHEEVGSTTATGAAGSLLPSVLGRLADASGANLPVALANSACISADGAHATHPNYVDRHEPDHRIKINGGPVIKRNANERYATSAVSQAIAEDACRRADVPYQHFVNRTDLACGSTIGPITSAQLGVRTVDMGMPQLSMHSARELCGADDVSYFDAALTAFLGT